MSEGTAIAFIGISQEIQNGNAVVANHQGKPAADPDGIRRASSLSLSLDTPEATSALDATHEAHLYGLMITSGAAPLSVSHRPGLRAFHQRELRLDGQGGWSLRTLG